MGRGVAAALLFAVLPASAQTLEEAEREEDYIRVVQTSPFTRGGRLQIAPTFGFSINDPLLQQFLVGANISYFFTESIAFHVQFHYAFDTRRASQNALLANQLQPEINPLQWVGTGGVEWVPAYGKFALFNGPIVYWDAYLTGTFGAANTKRGGNAPTGAAAVGTRLYLTSWLTLLFEVRDYLYQEEFTATSGQQRWNFINNVVFSVGASFFLPPRRGN
jgi:outer membrane beta-barrel protein